ncbi:MAG: hypothetical protein FWE53_03680 [Firmicutes bacterium]|nr:hypothetical protein [Bacillota bacterium]
MKTYEEIVEELQGKFPDIDLQVYSSGKNESYVVGFNKKGEGVFAVVNSCRHLKGPMAVFTFGIAGNQLLGKAGYHALENASAPQTVRVTDADLQAMLRAGVEEFPAKGLFTKSVSIGKTEPNFNSALHFVYNKKDLCEFKFKGEDAKTFDAESSSIGASLRTSFVHFSGTLARRREANSAAAAGNSGAAPAAPAA